MVLIRNTIWILPALALIVPSVASALVTVTPVDSNGNELKNMVTSGSTSIVYYGVRTDANSADDGGDTFDTGFSLMDVRSGQPADTTRPNVFHFNVKSSAASAQAETTLVVAVSVGGKQVPIASVNGNACNNDICMVNSGPLGTAYYLAAKYNAGNTTRIGIYPKDVCATVASDGNGCTSDSKVKALPGAPANMPLQIEFKTVDKTGALSTTALESISTFSIRMQVDKPKIGCPDLRTLYFPGDEEILVNSAGFYNSTAGTPAPAPAQYIYLVADENRSVNNIDDTVAGFRNNQNVQLIPIGDVNARVGGFINTTTGNDHKYAVSFLIRDAAGMLASASGLTTPASCRLSEVQTSNIQGFLKQSKCFIATAAFRSIEAGPVDLLRKFRDHFLLRFKPGRTFVQWYYSWSPKSGEWLMRHPAFRAPVLVSLIPLQLFAWLILNSKFLMIAGLLSLLPAWILLDVRRRGHSA